MWEKSRFLNADASVSVPSWANDTANETNGTYIENGFENENFPAVIYPNAPEYSWMQPNSDGNGSCYSGSDYNDFKAVFFGIISPTQAPTPSTTLAINQWMKVEIDLCNDAYNVNNKETRPLYNWRDSMYVKLLRGYNFWNFGIFFMTGYYINGTFYTSIYDAISDYESQFPNSDGVFSSSVRAEALIKNNGQPGKTFSELQNFTGMSTSPPAVVDNLGNTLPDFDGLQNTFQEALADKDSAISNSNATVTNLLGDYFDAVEFAVEELAVREEDLNTALALCDTGDNGACANVGELSTTVNQLRSDLDFLQTEQGIKANIETALGNILSGGSNSGLDLGDAAGNIALIESDLESKQSQIDTLTSDLSAAEANIEQIQDAAATNVTQITTNFNNQILGLNSEIDQKQNQISGLQDDLNDALDEVASGIATISEKQDEIDGYILNINGLNNDISQLQSEKEDAINQISDLTTTNNSITLQLNNANTNIASLESDKADLQGQIETLTLADADNSVRISELEADIEGLDADIAQLQADKQNALDLLADEQGVTADLGNEISGLNTDIINLNAEKVELQADINGLNIEVNNILGQLTLKQEQLDTALAQGVQDESTIAGLNADIDGINADLALLNVEKEELQADVNTITLEKEEAEQNYADALVQIANEQDISADFQTQLNEKIIEANNIQAQLDVANQDKADLVTQLDSVESDYDAVNVLLSQIESDNTALASQIESEISALSTALSAYGYEQENFSGFSGGSSLVDLVNMAGQKRKQYLNFKGQLSRQAYIQESIQNKKVNFTKPKKSIKFRADGEKSFEEKYGTLGKIGLIGGLLYLITKK